MNQAYPKVWQHMKLHYPNYGINQGLQSKEWWLEFVERIFCSTGFAGESHTLSKIGHKIYDHFKLGSSWEVYPDTHQTLTKLRQNGVRLAIISNFDERMSTILKNLDLTKYFEFMVTSVEAGHEKPAPEIFRYALNKAEMDPMEAAHVGDDLHLDYLAAKRAGMHAFLLNAAKTLDDDSFKDVEKGCIIKKLSDLEGLVISRNVLYV